MVEQLQKRRNIAIRNFLLFTQSLNSMKISKCLLILLAALCMLPGLKAQTQAPGIDILGYGYDVFGNYADQRSKKRYCLFVYDNFRNIPIGSEQYSVPRFVIFENISDHQIKTVSGESIRDYAQSLSVEAGLGVDALFFKGTINASYSGSVSGTEQKFYYTYMDANIKWRISFDERNLDDLKTILDPQFKRDLATMAPARLFELYGTHFIASAYLGGRADFTSETVITEETVTHEIGLAVEAKYKKVTANVDMEAKHEETLKNSKTEARLRVTGGNSQYANNISDPETYRLWASGIERMPVLADFDASSLRPIWDFCEDEGRRNILIAEFERMCQANPLPKEMARVTRVANRTFYVKSVADKTWWDLPGFHYMAEDRGGKIRLFEKDLSAEGLQGADRFIKVIPHTTKPEFVYFQPQHSDFVAEIIGGSNKAGTEIHLAQMSASNEGQMFSMIRVDGSNDTYYIKNLKTGLFLTSRGDKKTITQEPETKADNQKWVFEIADGTKQMAPPTADFIYSLQNIMGKRFIDVPGSGADANGKDAKLQLWDMNDQPDRFVELIGLPDKQHFVVQHMHSPFVWDITDAGKQNGARLRLWDRNNSGAQSFKFVYAGSPMTYFIINRGSNKAIDASHSRILQNGAHIQIWDWTQGDQQKWKLTKYRKWQMPDKDAVFHIKAAYSNRTWDIPGAGAETNANGKPLQLWDPSEQPDRKFKILPSGDARWINIQIQNGGRFVAIGKNSSANREPAIIFDKTNGNDQKFAIMFTSPTTFTIRTKNWKTLDCAGGPANYNKNGTPIIQWDDTRASNQQFQLIYSDGPNKGKPFVFQAGLQD